MVTALNVNGINIPCKLKRRDSLTGKKKNPIIYMLSIRNTISNNRKNNTSWRRGIGWFNTPKSTNAIYHANRIKKKNPGNIPYAHQ